MKFSFNFFFFILLFSCTSKTVPQGDPSFQTYTGQTGNYQVTLHLAKDSNFSGYLNFADLPYPLLMNDNPDAKNAGDSIYLYGGVRPLSVDLRAILTGDRLFCTMILNRDDSTDETIDIELNPDKNSTRFDYVSFSQTKLLPDSLQNKSDFRYSSSTIWPENNTDHKEDYKSEILLLAGFGTNDSTMIDMLREDAEKSYHEWKKQTDSLTVKEASEYGMSLSREILQQTLVMYESKKTITFAKFVYEYTGGAHGNYGTITLNSDKKTGKHIKLEDVLMPEGIAALPNLLDQAARKLYKIGNNKKLDENGFFVDRIKPSENFYLTESGIGFIYGPYELRSYADGQIALFVPAKSLKPYITANYF